MRIAAIDIGTNSLHMIVCRVRPDLSFEVIDREKDMIRLGTGGLDGRRLADARVDAAVHTLSKFLRIAAARGVDEIVATATSAVREARNGADFVARVRHDLGLHVRVISGAEESRLIHLAVAYAVDLGSRPAIVVDIGGGSTEIVVGTAERIQHARSFKLGVIRLTERFVVSEDGTSLIYSGVVEDPVFLAQPVQWSGKLEYRPNMRHSNQKCDVEVARRFLSQ